MAAPALSIVVVSFTRELDVLRRCLVAVRAQEVRGGTEVIVVRCWPPHDEGSSRVKAQFADVTWLDADCPTIPHLRRLGVAKSHGEIVALVEDDCVVDGEWAAAVLRGHRGPHVAIGGAVEPGDYRSARDWAAYFCDYGSFMLPFARNDTWRLAGSNLSYKRSVVPDLLTKTATDGLQEVFLHRAWDDEGKVMLSDPAIVVRNEHRWDVRDLVTVPFFHGRAYGAGRARAWSLERRLLYAAGTPVLPLLHIARIVQRVVGRRRATLPLVRALPWVAVFGVSWAAGECLGYAIGPGDSLRRWQ